MTCLRCTALRSDDTLGFLAALGVVELCSSSLDGEVLLAWENVGGAALLEVPLADTQALATHLYILAKQMEERGQALPCADQGPIRPAASQAERARRQQREDPLDPAKLGPTEAVAAYARMRSVANEQHDRDSARWLSAMLNQLAVVDRRKGLCALTPLYSPSGQMTLFQLYYLEHLKKVVASPGLVEEALVGWRRRSGTGANLDTRALRDSVAGSTGRTDNAAVLGASWLALMSVPFFRQVGNGRSAPGAVGWRAERGRGLTLRWPVWTEPLDRAAIEVLLAHPQVAEMDGERDRRSVREALSALGVTAMCTSRRRPLSNSAGALQPPAVVSVQ